MKKIVSLLLALCLVLCCLPVLAEKETHDDYPFLPDVDYTQRYTDYGAKPSMLNFGSVKMEDVSNIGSNSVKKTTIKKATAASIEEALVDGTDFYYIYAKYQTAQSVPDHSIDTMLVMTDPTGNYYTGYDQLHVQASGSNYRYSGLARFFNASYLLARCFLDHNGLPEGEYTFTMYFNNKFFRENTLLLY